VSVYAVVEREAAKRVRVKTFWFVVAVELLRWCLGGGGRRLCGSRVIAGWHVLWPIADEQVGVEEETGWARSQDWVRMSINAVVEGGTVSWVGVLSRWLAIAVEWF
jgi:hypothetical protein